MLDVFDFKKDKLSHPNKTIVQHIKEVYNISNKLLNYLDYPNNDIIYYLAYLHDIGKFHKDWEPGNKKIKHALWSSVFLYLVCKNNLFNIQIKDLKDALIKFCSLSLEYKSIINFFVRNHHANVKRDYSLDTEWRHVFHKLSLPEKQYIDYRKYLTSAKDVISKKEQFIDYFGIFKIADILSATNLKNLNIILPQTNINPLGFTGKNLDVKKLKLQEQISKNYDVLIAPTGWGKTLVAVFRMLQRKRAFYILPTITSINSMVERLIKSINIELGSFFYFFDAKLSYLYEDDDFAKKLLRSRYFLYPINVTTYHQVLFSLGKVKSDYPITRILFRNSSIIFDEFHLIHPKLFLYLLGLIKYYNNELNYNIKPFFMSATPTLFHNRLLDEYSVIDIHKKEGIQLKNIGQLEHFNSLEDFINWLTGKIDKLLVNYKKILIISNRVDDSILIYQALKDKFKNVSLIHSRFCFKDKTKKENYIKNMLEKEDQFILVSTQVSEVSLDVDFDFLITEMSPLPSLIQRLGRVNRRGLKDTKNFIVYKIDNNFKPYNKFDIIKTQEILEEMNEISNINLINEISLFMTYYEKFYSSMSILDVFNKIKGRLVSDLWEEINVIGEIPSVMVIPDIYIPKVEELIKLAKKQQNINKKRYLLSKIKNYFVTVPLYFIDKKDIDSPFGELKEEYTYSEEYGVIKKEHLDNINSFIL